MVVLRSPARDPDLFGFNVEVFNCLIAVAERKSDPFHNRPAEMLGPMGCAETAEGPFRQRIVDR